MMFNMFRSTALAVQRQFNHYDSAIHQDLQESTLKQHPPVFIVGSPRTGSTLLYQMLLSQFRLSYISNSMALLPAHMIKLAKIYPKAASGFVGAYKENKYGYVAGLFSPNEAGKILGKWFDDISANQHQAEVRRTVMALTEATGAPFILKNQRRLTINISILRQIFPEARYIITHRDPRYAAQSMLIARRNFTGGDHEWWNVKPEGYESVLDQDAIYQVLWQVMTLEEIARHALQDLAIDNSVIIMDYEQLCLNPQDVFGQLQQQFNLVWREDRETLEPQKVSKTVRLTDEEWQRMEAHYAALKPEFSM